MSADVEERNLAWLSFTIEEALRLGVFQPANLLAHATPEVLAQHLPRELMVKVFATAFSTGKLTPEGILGVAPPATLARHVAPSILWAAVREAAARQQLPVAGAVAAGHTPVRTWIGAAIAAALTHGLATPADVTRHVPPSAWVREVPNDLVAKMFATGLGRAAFNPALAIEVLTPALIGEHVSTRLSWGAIDEFAVRAFKLSSG